MAVTGRLNNAIFSALLYEFLIGLSLCEDTLCPLTIPNGYIIKSSCSRHYGTFCYRDGYKCGYSYVKHSPPLVLKCNHSGQWQWNESESQPCVRELCPSNIKNGKIDLHGCTRSTGSYCAYNCHPGCTQNPRAKVWLFCVGNGRWDEDIDSLCINCPTGTETTVANLCPATIHRGRIVQTCDRRHYSSCSYTCDTGCSRRFSELTCRSDLSWSLSSDACMCSGSDTKPYTSSAAILGIVVTVVMVIVVVSVCARNRRHKSTSSGCAISQDTEYHTTVTGRPSVVEMPVGLTPQTYGRTSPNYGLTSPNYTNPQGIYYSSLQLQQTSEDNTYTQLQQQLGDKNYDKDPPAYNSIAPIVERTEYPPSYEEVTSNPVEFKV